MGYFFMCLGAGSNRRPLALQANALPTELPKQNYFKPEKPPTKPLISV
jgi:hypothetical protein